MNAVPVVFPSEFVGGHYDGVTMFLNAPLNEVLMVRGEWATKQLPHEEAQFNISLHGRPYPPDVEYDRYEVTDKLVMKNIDLPDGRKILNVNVRIYQYTGVVSGPDSEGIQYL
jgi:hypothetical protein